MERHVTIIGGGLAGAEAAWQAATRGTPVHLHEMRPTAMTAAHKTASLAELVCSNSFKSRSLEDASGLLKEEMRRVGSLIIAMGDAHAVPAGSALAVEREGFARAVTGAVESLARVEIIREEVLEIPEARPLIIATGPLTSERLSKAIERLFGEYLLRQGSVSGRSPLLYFYDAISPIVSADSLERDFLFAASRYGEGTPDYLNAPLTREQYVQFRTALLSAEMYPLHAFEETRFFEACLPVEELARRGEDTLRFGPMKPVGLTDPRTARRPYAVVQLRKENREGTMYNLVGFQTRMRRGEQARIFRALPGLAQAEFLRYGSVHRNTFLTAPALLLPTLQFRGDEGIFFAGQITGVEGYIESAGTGLLAGINAARLLSGTPLVSLPPTTALGSLVSYLITADPARFQPMNVNFGLLPPLSEKVRERRERNRRLAARALTDLEAWRGRTLSVPA